MEETKSSTQFDECDDEFHDAVDEFEFYDCRENFSDQTESSRDELISNPSSNPPQEDKSPALSVLRRRRSRSSKKSFGDGPAELAKFGAAESVDRYLRERRNVSLSPKFEEHEMRLEDTKPALQSNETSEEKSTVTDAIAAALGEESSWRGNEDSNPGFLLKLPGIVIKRIALLVKIVTFTIRLVYYSYMIVFNPLGLLLPLRWFIIQQLKKIWNLMFGIVSEYVYEWLKEQRAIWKLGLKCGWGLLWSAYVCSVLLGLLVSAFVVGGVLIRMVVDEPIRMTRSLNFDYSEKSPVALVPIMSGVKMNVRHFVEKPKILKAGESRVVPRDHGVHVTVSLTLPESEYNQRLGMFQVRVDFVAADGQILATLRRPCMLKYRSQSIRLLLTLLKVAPILTGYTSETQKLKANFKDFTEGDPPTASIRVILEQRAEYSPTGAGIPEIYSASLTLESELPLLKRILWFWKKTVFVWVSMSVFMIELVFALLCCRPLIIPKIRLWEPTPQEGASHYNRPRQS
ncbi:seipin-2-like isoform X1 [Salvia hispanica]|uniref:seipin-2-like isoform X1 n=1 Tax=Salvia hispanica TaxID=49212 RepID=UPI00200937C6|nr:seipin-2-like isoform X1 [Salvia hispanica]